MNLCKPTYPLIEASTRIAIQSQIFPIARFTLISLEQRYYSGQMHLNGDAFALIQ